MWLMSQIQNAQTNRVYLLQITELDIKTSVSVVDLRQLLAMNISVCSSLYNRFCPVLSCKTKVYSSV